MLLGLSTLSFEIENPFGNDNNDLPLDRMCDVISTDIDVICAHKMSLDNRNKRWMINEENRPLMPVSNRAIEECLATMTVEEIQEALWLKVGRVKGDGGADVEDDGNEGPGKAGIYNNNGAGSNGSLNVDVNGNGQARSGEIVQLPV